MLESCLIAKLDHCNLQTLLKLLYNQIDKLRTKRNKNCWLLLQKLEKFQKFTFKRLQNLRKKKLHANNEILRS